MIKIKAKAAMQRGTPHNYYHDRTGIVCDVTPSTAGVTIQEIIVNMYLKQVSWSLRDLCEEE